MRLAPVFLLFLISWFLPGRVWAQSAQPTDPVANEMGRISQLYGPTHIRMLWIKGTEPAHTYQIFPRSFAGSKKEPVFRAASLSKPLVGIAMMKLVEARKLDLNTPVKQLLPEIEIDNPWAATDPVRVIHLLEHTAGFDDMHFNEFYVHDADSAPSLAEVLQRNPNSRKVRWRPGTFYAYSNSGYLVAGRVIEKVTGEAFESWMKREVLEPMGMKNASFLREAPAVQGVDRSGEAVPYRHVYMRPAAGLQCTAADLEALVRFFLNRGRVDTTAFLSPEAFDQLKTPESSFAAGAGSQLGYAKGLEVHYFNGLLSYSHRGNISGFSAEVRYFPEDSIGLAVFANAELPGDVLDRLQGILLAEAKGAAAQVLPSAWAMNWGDPVEELGAPLRSYHPQFEGYYQFTTPRYDLLYFVDRLTTGLSVRARGDGLELQRGPERIQLLPAGVRGQYFARDDFGTTALFGTDPEIGDWVFFRDQYYIKTSTARLSALQVLFGGSLCLMVLGIAFFALSIWSHFANGVKFFYARMANSVPGLCLAGMAWAGTKLELITMGTGNVWEWLIFLLGILMLLGTLLGSWQTALAWRKPKAWLVKGLLTASALANVIITGYLALEGMIGLRLWVY